MVKGKKGGKSKMKLQLEELGRRGKGRKGDRKESLKGERKDSLKGDLEEDVTRGLAVENLYVTLPLPPSNSSSPEKRFIVLINYSSLVSLVSIGIFAAATIRAPRKALDHRQSLLRPCQHPAHHQVQLMTRMIYHLIVTVYHICTTMVTFSRRILKLGEDDSVRELLGGTLNRRSRSCFAALASSPGANPLLS